MASFYEIVPGDSGRRLGNILYEASAISHAQNGLRFDAEELGDGNRQYGDLTANTARHLAGQMIDAAGLENVEVCQHGLVWWLEISRSELPMIRIYLYKAPPGSRSVWGVTFDSEIKQHLSRENAAQPSLFRADEPAGDPLNLVAVHYGSPHEGFVGLDIGAPYLADESRVAWAWSHQVDGRDDAMAPPESALGDDGAGFAGLRLVEDERETSAEDLLPLGEDAIDGLDIGGADDDAAEEEPAEAKEER